MQMKSRGYTNKLMVGIQNQKKDISILVYEQIELTINMMRIKKMDHMKQQCYELIT